MSAGTAQWELSLMRLILPSNLSEAFDSAVGLLSAGLPEQHLVLSGGSVLQAIWGHRTSTDLDFFLPATALGKHMGLRHDRMRIAARSVEGGGHWVEGFDADGVQGRVAGVRFSVGVAHWMHLEFGRDTVEETRAQAATIEEVFIGKIHGRFRFGRRGDGRVPIRDLYDMTVCMRESPKLLHDHFSQLRPDQVRIYAKRLHDMPPNWHELDEDRIIGPTYDVDLHSIPQTVAHAVVQRDASLIPVAEKTPVFDGDDGDGTMGGGPS